MTRREFTRSLSGSALGLGALATSGGEAEAAFWNRTKPVALQLYTVRELAGKDFTGTLEKVAKIGYDGVEFAGYGGLSAKEMKQRLDDLGLKCAGTHEGFESLEKNLAEVIDYNREIGNKFLVCPSMPGEWRDKGADGFRAFGQRMNAIGEQANKAGMRLCYHNHSFEFKKENDKYLIEYLFEAVDPKLVGAEVDVYWVQHGGEDPASFIRRHAGRCPLIHMKDMAKDASHGFAPVGTGILDNKAIIRASRDAKAEWFTVEQDSSKQPILGEIETSLKNMRELLKG
ncbi:MAG: sugar phosphate isomerase/epimerase family protein [Candidatus Latescibacterota bacterium]